MWRWWRTGRGAGGRWCTWWPPVRWSQPASYHSAGLTLPDSLQTLYHIIYNISFYISYHIYISVEIRTNIQHGGESDIKGTRHQRPLTTKIYVTTIEKVPIGLPYKGFNLIGIGKYGFFFYFVFSLNRRSKLLREWSNVWCSQCFISFSLLERSEGVRLLVTNYFPLPVTGERSLTNLEQIYSKQQQITHSEWRVITNYNI